MITPPSSRLAPSPSGRGRRRRPLRGAAAGSSGGGGRGAAAGPAADLYSFQELWRHWRRCRRNKRSTANALRFELDAEAGLLALGQELREHTYRPGRSICFVTEGPKPREVFAADFRDRIVHHLLVAHLEPLFERRFIHDSFACRKGKGTLAASDRLTTFLRRITANGKRRAYALKLDVASFFSSIDKAVLSSILDSAIRHPELRWLVQTVLFHDPTLDYRFKPHGPRGERRRPRAAPESGRYPVPAQKSLFGKGNQRGLPIGNLTSQFWANVYLNELDQFVKRTLRVACYVRYVDDLVLLSEDPRQLEAWQAEIERFLAERLHLSLRPDRARPRLVSCGIDFVGWRTWWSHRLPRRRTLAALGARLAGFERAAVRRSGNGETLRVDLGAPAPAASARPADQATAAERLAAALASYSGHLRHGASFRAWQRIMTRRRWLDAVFERRGLAIAARFSRLGIQRTQSFSRRYWQTIRGAGTRCLVFYPVGCFVELRGPQRLLAERTLGLRAGRVRRAGYAFACGFPHRLTPRLRARALRAGLAVLELGGRPPGVRGTRAPWSATLTLPSYGAGISRSRQIFHTRWQPCASRCRTRAARFTP